MFSVNYGSDSSFPNNGKYIIYDNEKKIVLSTDNFEYYKQILANSEKYSDFSQYYNYNTEKNQNIFFAHKQEKEYHDSIDKLSNKDADKHDVIKKYKEHQQILWNNNTTWMRYTGLVHVALIIAGFIVLNKSPSGATRGKQIFEIIFPALTGYYGGKIIHDAYRMIRYGLSERDETWIYRPGMNGHIYVAFDRKKERDIIKKYSNLGITVTVKEKEMYEDLAKIINGYRNNKLIIQNILFLLSSYMVLKN